MTRLLLCVIVSIFSLFVSPSFASDDVVDGNGMLHVCAAIEKNELTEEEVQGRLYCQGYITGFHEALAVIDGTPAAGGSFKKEFCFPSGVTIEQSQRVFVKWLRQNPEKLHLPAAVLLNQCFRQVYPCK